MTLDRLRPYANKLLVPFVNGAERLGVTPDGVSLLAFVAALAAGGTYATAGDDPGLFLVGAVFVFANGWLDLLDGALARRLSVQSPGGDLLDHVLDRYADVIVIAGLTIGIERYGLGFAAVTGVLLTSYLGTQVEAVGLTRTYGGLLGRADRLALIGIVTGGAAVFRPTVYGFGPIGWLLIVFAVVGHLTALQRFLGAWSDLRSTDAQSTQERQESDGSRDEIKEIEPDDGDSPRIE